MNERIRELRRQATLVETYTSHDGSVHEGKSVDLEKFAELIVRECMLIVGDGTVDGEIYHDRIKYHFGVEE
jgi:hypothetical protein